MKTNTNDIIKTFFIICSFFCLLETAAQAPNKMSYQAVLRNSANALITNQPVGMRVTVLQTSITGTEVYKEIFNPNPITNANGLVTIEIGTGIPVTGTFAAIDWGNGPYFIKTETDPTGGTNYTISGTSQLMSVPYAFQAQKAEIANDVQGVQMFYYIITQGFFPTAGAELDRTIGTIIAHAGFAPLPASDNYKLCNGAIISITQNTALFTIIGTTYGGNGIQTFALPNLTGKVIKGK